MTPSFVSTLPNRTKKITAGSTMLLSPTLTNDLRFNYSESYAAQIYRQDTFGGAKLRAPEFVFPTFAEPATFGRPTQIRSAGLGGLNPLFQVGGPGSLQLSLRVSF